MMTEKEIHDICKKYYIRNYKINPDGSIDVNGNVDLSYMGLTKIPLKFNKVNGWFDCSYNKLTSLEGCPKEVEWSFYCYGCKRNFTGKEVKALCKVKGNIGLKKY